MFIFNSHNNVGGMYYFPYLIDNETETKQKIKETADKTFYKQQG